MKNLERIFLYVGLFCGISSLCVAWYLFNSHSLGPDAGYYIMNSKMVMRGKIPFVDFFSMHLPFSYYFQAMVFYIFGDSLRVVQGMLYSLSVVNFIGIFLLVRLVSKNNLLWIGWLLSLYMLLAVAMEGLQYSIEPLCSVFGVFGLLSAVYCTKQINEPRRFILLVFSGVLVGLAFLTKQIGIAYLVGVIIILKPSVTRKSFIQLGVLVLSLLSPLALFLILYPDVLQHLYRQAFVTLVSYSKGQYLGDQRTEALQTFLENFWVSLTIGGAFIYAYLRQKTLLSILGGVCATAGLLLTPTVLKPYLHYYLLSIPFALCGAWIVLVSEKEIGKRFIIFFIIVSVIFSSSAPAIYAYRVRDGFSKDNQLFRQTLIAQWIKSRSIDSDTIMIVPDSPEYYFLTGKSSPSDNYLFTQTNEDYEIAQKRKVPVFVIDRGGELTAHSRDMLAEYGFEKADQSNSIEYWTAG